MSGEANVIAGLGETGLSFARFLAAKGEPFAVMDSGPDASRIQQLREINPDARVYDFSLSALSEAQTVYVSPGVPLNTPELQSARQRGVRLRGDVEMFGEFVSAPLVAITGTNGKSTVSELVYSMASMQFSRVCLAGNIGTPCLDVLDEDASLYVLELSSYQLELASALRSKVAVVLNLTPDHLDRYESVQSYYETKLGLYGNCEMAVVNRELADRVHDIRCDRIATFGIDHGEDESHFGLEPLGDGYLLMKGREVLMASQELQVSGLHNLLNVLAAFATGWLLGLDKRSMVSAATAFKGLAHRSEVVGTRKGVRYINDSKATNEGALVAAVAGQATGENVHLIAGGVSKGADFEYLEPQIKPYVKRVYLIGQAAEKLAAALTGIEQVMCENLSPAVFKAAHLAAPGDVVLLAPGCASFDEFQDYRERGEAFRRCVQELEL